MSSPGQIPPNIIRGAGTVSREQIIQEQEQQRAEQARQDQLNAQRAQQAERDAAIREANARVANDPLAQQGREQIAADDLKDLITSGSSIKQLKALGYDVDYLTYSTNPKTGAIENLKGFKFVENPTTDGNSSSLGQSQAPAPEKPVFGSLTLSQAKAAFQNPYRPDFSATERGYAQLQQAQQQVGDYYTKPVFGSLTAAQAARGLYIPNENAQRENQAMNVSIAYNATKEPENPNLSDFGMGQPVSGKPFSFEQIGQYNTFSRTNVMLTQAPPSNREYYIPNPANPFDIRARDIQPVPTNQRIATPATNPSFTESLTAGYQNYFGNIQETIASGAGRFRQPNYAPELESAAMNAVLQGMKDAPTGLNLLGQIAKESAENPGYAIGSVAASIGFTVSTIGAGKIANLARAGLGGLDTLRASTKVSELAEVAARNHGISDVSVTAMKIDKSGIEIPLKRGPTGIYTEPAAKFGVRTSKPALPDYYRIESKAVDKTGTITSLEDVGYASTKTKGTAITAGVLNEEEAAKFLEPGPGKPAASTYTAVAQQESNVLKNVGTYTRIRGNEGVTTPIVKTTGGAKVSEAVDIGGFVTYQNKELAKFTGEIAKPKSAAAAKSIGKPFTGSNISRPSVSAAKSGKSVLSTLSKNEQAAAVKKAALDSLGVTSEKATAKGANSVIPGLVGNAAKAVGGFSGYASRQSSKGGSSVSLGFGGATGAERKAAKKAVEELTQSFIPVPESSSKSSTNSISKTLQNLTSNTGTKSQNSLIPTGITKGLESFMPKQESVLSSLLNTSQLQNTRTTQRTETAALSGIASTLMPALATKQAQGFRFDLITKIPNPSKEPPFFNFSLPGLEGSKKSKKHKKGAYRYGERAFRRSDIIANSVSGEIARLINNAIGPVE